VQTHWAMQTRQSGFAQIKVFSQTQFAGSLVSA
jgi:hypothetical protein